jgi:hypothetical protein
MRMWIRIGWLVLLLGATTPLLSAQGSVVATISTS